MRHEQRLLESHASSEEKLQTGKSSHAATWVNIYFYYGDVLEKIESMNADRERHNYFPVGSGDTSPLNNGCLRPPLHELKDSPGVKRRSRHVARLNMGEAKDDIHVCILCMRAIMNNKVQNWIYRNWFKNIAIWSGKELVARQFLLFHSYLSSSFIRIFVLQTDSASFACFHM